MDERLKTILGTPMIIRNEDPFPEEELTGKDYLERPIFELIHHPDFSPQALRAIATISQMTSAQLESLKFTRGEN